METICTSESGTISSSDALNLTDQIDKPKRLSKADAQTFFTRLEQQKWLMVNSYYYYCYLLNYYYHFMARWILSMTTRVSRHQKGKTRIYWSKKE